MQAYSSLAYQVAETFAPEQSELSLTPLGNGLINDTYLVSEPNRQWVLQRINRTVFPEPKHLLENLTVLTQHIQNKRDLQKKLQIPAILKNRQNLAYSIDSEGQFWRALEFIPNSFSKERCENLSDAAQIGWALGHFHSLCNDLDVKRLHDTLPGFHITPSYFDAYRQALISSSKIIQDERYHYCVEFIAQRQNMLTVLEQAKQDGLLKLRVMHGDPKVNNFLFDLNSNAVLSIIDLDTVKPGLLHYDIGDCLRSVCCDPETGEFQLDVCEALLKNYLREVKNFFNDADYHYLYAAIRLIPLELGIRFFCDYLQGNAYFKVTEAQQNLTRATQQFRLCHSIEGQQAEIEQLIQRLRND